MMDTPSVRGAASVLSAVLSLVLSTPMARAAEPTGYIPSLRATVNGMGFFAAAGTAKTVPFAERRYDDRFVVDSLPFVHVDLDLSHPPPGRRLPFVLETVWRGPEGVGRRDSYRYALEPSWSGSNWTTYARLVLSKVVTVPNRNDVFRCRDMLGEWGPCDATSDVTLNYWPRGTYQVDIFVDNTHVASNQFRVIPKTQMDAEMRARISDGSRPSGHVDALNGRVTALRLYDAGPPAPRAKDRQYSAEFSRGAARSIGWELHVKHPRPGRWRPVTVEAFWYRGENAARQVVHRKVLQLAVSAQQEESRFDDDSGAIAALQAAGTYQLDLFVAGKKVAAGTFKVR